MNRARSPRPIALAALLSVSAAALNAQARDSSQAIAVSTIGAAASRDTVAKKTDSVTASVPPKPAESAPLGLRISGYAEASYNFSNHPSGGVVTGRIYDRFNNQFAANALKIALDRPYDPTSFDAGFHADFIFGQNAAPLQSVGFNLGANGDLYQLFGTLNIPTANGNGVQLKFGRMATLLGLEVIETIANPNVSEGNQFIYMENFTANGLSLEHRFNKYLDTQLRVLNGWDQVQDVNARLSYMGRVGFAPDSLSMIAVVGFVGPEEADNNSAQRSGFELLLNRKFGRVTAWMQGDLGREEANAALPDSTRAAKWWALGGWISIDASPRLGVSLRGDYFDDHSSARTGAAFGIVGAPAHRLWSATSRLNIKTWPNVLVRPELRFDRSNHDVFGAKRSQFTFGLGAAYIY